MNKLMFFIGLSFIMIPFGIRMVTNYDQQKLVATHEEQWQQMDDSATIECMEKARRYNEKLYAGELLEHDAYEKQLNLLGNQVMCSLEIPKIHLKLPVGHGTEEDVLSTNIGHMKGSSLPVGGKNTHSVLCGHRGLPNAELFTRLDDVELGDSFYIVVCNKKLSYKIVEIQVVDAGDTDCVKIQEGRDLVSLVTCTPYGLNTHRLIVTGERIF